VIEADFPSLCPPALDPAEGGLQEDPGGRLAVPAPEDAPHPDEGGPRRRWGTAHNGTYEYYYYYYYYYILSTTAAYSLREPPKTGWMQGLDEM